MPTRRSAATAAARGSVILLGFALAACGHEGDSAAFAFQPSLDGPGVEVLDWRYVAQHGGGEGAQPNPPFLYFKWQPAPEQPVREQRIPLQGLPRSMDGRQLRVVFEHQKPVVYLITPDWTAPSGTFRGRRYNAERIERLHPGPAGTVSLLTPQEELGLD